MHYHCRIVYHRGYSNPREIRGAREESAFPASLATSTMVVCNYDYYILTKL